MNKNEKISIIVPVYKSEKYLNRCVESLIHQTYNHIEIILVDDGSPDECPKMCDNWADKDSRIKVIHKENGGAFSARFAGIATAEGDYIGFVDSDDWVEADMYEYLLSLIKKYSADVANIKLLNVEGKDSPDNQNPIEKVSTFDFAGILENMNSEGFWSLCNNLYKKELFAGIPNGLPTDLVFSEDMLMNYFLYKQVKTMAASNLIKYYYYRHSESAIAGELNYSIVDDAVLAYNIIDADMDKNSSIYPYSVAMKITNDLFLINSIIRNNKCLDRYETLRKDILKHKKYVFSKKCSKIFSFKHKAGIILLLIAPKIYNKTILIRRSVRGY